jgi:uncharacterized glyoxalase superfamily protein PhnB
MVQPTEQQLAGRYAMSVHIDAVGVVVSDMKQAISFYERLGCSFPADAADGPHAESDLGGARLMLDSAAALQEMGLLDDGDSAGGGRVALAARCDSPAEVDRLYAELASDGFGQRPPWDAPWGQRYAVVADPDGTHIDLYAARPG